MSQLQPSVANAAVTFTIPLQISVTLGVPVADAAMIATSAPAAISVTPAAPARTAVSPISTEGLFFRAASDTVWEDTVGKFSLESLRATKFDWHAALSLVLASKLVYSDSATVKSTATDLWKLDRCEFFDIDDTQCFVAISPDVVLISFRGTESTGDWIANLNTFSMTRPYGIVHRGFYSQFLAVFGTLEQMLLQFPGRKVLLTGHSLGGALATIAAAEWRDRFPIAGVYTYGQPAVGRGDFQAVMADHYDRKFFRFVNNNDIVPRVPPNFSHVGKLIHFDRSGNVDSMLESIASGQADSDLKMLTEEEFDLLRSELLTERVDIRNGVRTETLQVPNAEGIFPSVPDHKLNNYITKIDKQATTAPLAVTT
jgi:pimeloyl-ACP methyl ester carboxylesterase